MTMDFNEQGSVSLTMEKYVQDIFEEYPVTRTAATPATQSLFEINADSELLRGKDKEIFHTCVAKLLYLAKRVRPDIITPIAFLTTRVGCSTVDDWKKLIRVLEYLNADRSLGIRISPGHTIALEAYIDASFAPHKDAKSHTGAVIALGKGPIYVRSGKQRLVSKSSAEAELIGVSDEFTQVIWCREFLTCQGYDMPATVVYQDNKSTIAMIDKGKDPSSRTRHINIRHFFVKERVDAGEITFKYLPTGEMLADIATKPLQGPQFVKLRNRLLNWRF